MIFISFINIYSLKSMISELLQMYSSRQVFKKIVTELKML